MKQLMVGIVAVAAILFVIELGLGQRPDRRSYQYFDDMVQSAAYKSQSVNPYLEHGQTQQAPVRGTIPRGHMPLRYGDSEVEMVRAGEEMVNPIPVDAKTVARGQVVYQTHCLVCHGAGGEGDGTVTKRGFPPPPSLLSDQTVDRTDGQIFHMMTYGYKNMPAYASQVNAADRWAVIRYVRRLQESGRNAQAASRASESEGKGE